MKFSILLISAFFLYSCGTQKAATEVAETNITQDQMATNNYRVIGVVQKNDSGCEFTVLTEVEPGVKKSLYAVNLDEKWKVDGMKIKFEYAMSRAMLPEGCNAEMTVSVSDVVRMR